MNEDIFKLNYIWIIYYTTIPKIYIKKKNLQNYTYIYK